MSETKGLADALEERAGAVEVLSYLDELNIYYASAGKPTSSPGDLVQNPRLGIFLKAMDEFDWIVIDSPPLATFADALTLANQADAVVLVARSGLTGRQDLQRAVDTLKANRSRIAAVVLNACDQRRNKDGYYSYYQNGSR
jgi:Mrp family chromosome partitioning ATPase